MRFEQALQLGQALRLRQALQLGQALRLRQALAAETDRVAEVAAAQTVETG